MARKKKKTKRGWYGDPVGHSIAAKKGWEKKRKRR